MSHLATHNLTYFGHLRRAWGNSLRLVKASMLLAIHGLFPNLLQYDAVTIVRDLARRMARPRGTAVLIRFNKKWEQDPFERKWRVLHDGGETLASFVDIRTESETDDMPITHDGEAKYHLRCVGQVRNVGVSGVRIE